VITFPEGLIGIPGTRYALVSQSETSAFYWLHSVDDPAIALPVTTPWLFFPTYEVQVADEDARRVALDGPEGADIFCVVRAAERLEDFTVNLRGPLVVNANQRLGCQIINEATSFDVREPLFAQVELEAVQPSAPAAPVAAMGV
jgi:flagellar assembly factor FliW